MLGRIISSSPMSGQLSRRLSRPLPVKALLLFFASCCAVLISTAAAYADELPSSNKPIADKWALVVGISKFQDPTISLKYASKDAADFADYLVKEAHFAPDHVRLLTDEKATRENILAQVGDKWLPRVAEPDDLVIIYVSSHGSPQSMDVSGISYLLAHNTDKESLYATGIPVQDLTRMIKERVHSQRIIVILDACHSGAAKADEKGVFRSRNVNADAISQGTGQLVICSSEPSQVSWESASYPNGVFTHHLIDGLKQKGEFTSLGEAFEYVRDKVKTQVLRERGELQQPVLRSKWQGDALKLSVRPASPRPGLPDSPSHIPGATQASEASHTVASSAPSAVRHLPSSASSSFGTVSEAVVKLPNRLAILPCAGPLSIKADDLWAGVLKKKNIELEKKPEIMSMAKDVQTQLTNRLKNLLKGKEIVESEVSAEGHGKGLSAGDDLVELGKLNQSKYLVRVVIGQFLIKDDSMADEARARVSAQLVDGETGEVLWQIKDKLFAFTPTMFRQDVGVFAEVKNVLPGRIAKGIAQEVAHAIKSQEVPTR